MFVFGKLESDIKSVSKTSVKRTWGELVKAQIDRVVPKGYTPYTPYTLRKFQDNLGCT